ncbi:Protein kinase domain containing protein, partial [Reticulomyxa filosa]
VFAFVIMWKCMLCICVCVCVCVILRDDSIDPPFETATETDRWYSFFVNRQYKQFWAKHKGCGVTKAAMDLITRMILFEPEKRISIAQIKQHPWYSGEILEFRKKKLHSQKKNKNKNKMNNTNEKERAIT